MNNKGFTLMELLGVIILICLLTLLVVPNVINSVRNYTSETDELTLSMIENAAKLYIDDNSSDFPKYSENNYCISIEELINKKYLSNSIEYKGEDITNTKAIKAVYNNGFDFELINKEDCFICKGVTEETKTLGNIPKGNYEPGDEYICEVKENIEYHFFVINKQKSKVNLIMDKNIGNVVSWGSNDNSEGPVNALEELRINTDDWTNIDLTYYTLWDDVADNYTLNVPGARARLLTYEEAINLDCKFQVISSSVDTKNTCKNWLYGNFSGTSKPYAYWLSSSVEGSTNYAWYITFHGDLRYTDAANNTNITTSNLYGIRPVISVSISKMSNS